MDKKEILKKIISESGSCDWVPEVVSGYVCDSCPIGKMAVREDGTKASCVEAVPASSSEYPSDSDYLRVAKQLLLDSEVEDMLLKDQDAK